ncbi:MAG: glycosyltransferase family 1 protein [Actinobacteria bacterium]|nr:glycosyltransferase family 1 protein [Actinomycetota bacterium]NDB41584.1 glycosyltransferase family 1 protein [Actinomycetota bacterium]
MTIRVGVNLMWLRTGQVGGSQEYLVRQLTGLFEANLDEFDVTLFVQAGFAKDHQQLAELYDCVEAPRHGGNRVLRILLEQTWLAVKARKFDLMHHGGGTMPFFAGRRSVLTIHDVQYLSFPENFSRTRLAYLSKVVPRSVARASLVSTPSEYVRQKLINKFAVSPAKVKVVRHGIDDQLGAAATSEQELRRRFRLENRDVLFLPAVTHPHKNHKFLLQLLKTHWVDKNLVLVCAGGKGRAELEFMREVRRLNLDDRVIRLNRVVDEDRDGLLKLAKALVFPSLYEGFGAPVIEAMQLGTPVIASDCAALPEIIGSAGLVLPLNLDVWSGALDAVNSRRDALVAAGKVRAKNFSIANSGKDLAQAYRAAM